ncbi:hypothetical protein BH23VER1_BH23VER1_01300 [soil metagenome]
MEDREKRVFRDMVERVGGFCGVRCLTYCIMGNHFHLLVEVRDGEREEFARAVEAGEADAEICRRVRVLFGDDHAKALGKDLGTMRAGGDSGGAWDRLGPLVARMNDLATFVKELKWRFSAWYNGENGRVGTLWESRYRSVLVEGSEAALAATAAYIDLNPVRAGLVGDPKDYRFCGYAEAVMGKGAAREGLRRVVGGGDDTLAVGEVLSRYRLLLFGQGRQRRDETGRVVRRGVSEEAAAEVERTGGALPLHEILRSRVRYLTEGAAVGSQEFLDRLLMERPRFFGPRRKRAGRPMRGGDWGELCAVRDLAN